MPLQIQPLLLGGLQNVKHALLALRHGQEVHHLGQPHNALELCQAADGICVELGA